MELKLVAKLSQSLVMTPQLKMAIKLLTLNHLELRDAVAQELIDNPVLEEVPDDTPRVEASRDAEEMSNIPTVKEGPVEVNLKDGDAAATDVSANIDWEAYAESFSHLPPSAGSGKDSSFDELPGIDQTLTRGETLEEHILWQVRMSDMNALERTIAARLMGEISDEGFLDTAPILQPGPPPPPEVKKDAYGKPVDTPPEKPFEKSLNKSVDKVASRDVHGVIGNGAGNGHGAAGLAVDDEDDEPALLGDGPDLGGDHLNGEDDDVDDVEPALLMDAPVGARVDPVQIVADDLDVPVEWVENVRQRVMRMDPIGVLSRDLRECLLTQLEVWGYDDECLVYVLIKNHLSDVERKNYASIVRTLKVSMEDIGEAVKLIEQLEPRPARNYIAQGESPDSQYITPDVYVHLVGDDWVISLNDDGLPKLKMSKFYLNKLREAQAARQAGVRQAADPSRTYIKDKMRSATWLIKSIQQRQRTIYRVVESILKHQRDWFDGNGPLKPLILKEVADDIEMHESTVSRVTSRKYMHTPRGVFELKYFFNSSINTGDGSNIASEAVKDEIKRIVTGENPKKPLSDAQIVKMLSEKNIDIARRTVAKYREMLGILPSSKRKQVF